MEWKATHRFAEASFVFLTQEGFTTCSYDGLSFYDSSFNLKDRWIDFFSPDATYRDKDSLFLRNDELGIEKVSLKTHKRVAFVAKRKDEEWLGGEFFKTEKGLSLIAFQKEDPYLVTYSLENLEETERILLPENVLFGCSVPFLNAVIVYGDKEGYLLKGNSLTPLPFSFPEGAHFFVDPTRPLLYVSGGLGIKVYDERLDEIGRMDLISEEQEETEEETVSFFPFDMKPRRRSYPKEVILSACVFTPDTFLLLVSAFDRPLSHLSLVSLKDGKPLFTIDTPFRIETIAPVKGKYVIFKAQNSCHVLEVKV